MNEKQRQALLNPCARKQELLAAASDARRQIGQLEDSFVSTLLTVDKMTFEGVTVINWHASVAILNDHFQPVQTNTVDRWKRRHVQRHLSRMLQGVGDARREEVWQMGEEAFHLFRALSDEEIARLPEEFVSTAAVDI